MASSNFGDWIAAANPFGKPGTRDQAMRAARLSSVSLVLTAVVGLVQGGVMWLNREQTAQAMGDFMTAFGGAAGAEAAEMQSAMVEAMLPGMILQSVLWSVVFAVLYLILARHQWTAATRWIPIVFLILGAYALLSLIGGALMMHSFQSLTAQTPGGAVMPSMPSLRAVGLTPWVMALTGVEAALAVILHTAALRGALALKRMQP